MWNGQPCIPYDKTIVKEDVDVDASRPFWNGAFSSKVLLDFEAVSQQVCRLQRSLRRYHLVQKPILILEIHRLGGIHGRDFSDLNPRVSQRMKSQVQILFPVSQIRSQSQKGFVSQEGHGSDARKREASGPKEERVEHQSALFLIPNLLALFYECSGVWCRKRCLFSLSQSKLSCPGTVGIPK